MTDDDAAPRHVPCVLAIQLLGDYEDGVLAPDVARDVEAHLALCPPCVTFLEQLRTARRLVGALPAAETLPPELADRLVAEFRSLLPPA